MSKIRKDLIAIYQAGLDAVAGKAVVNEEIKNNKYPKQFHVVSIGKAADAMLQGVPETRIISGLLISKHGHISKHFLQNSLHKPQNTKIKCIESDHPIPKVDSIKAGKALVQYLTSLPTKEPCLFLISGGTSALVEVLQEDWTLDDLSELTDYLLANAYPINKINAVRKQLSKIKGGGLWDYLGERDVHCLMISDVPNDAPTDIGSGLLFPATQQVTLPKLPSKWLKKIQPSKQKSHPDNFNWKIIASLSKAKDASAVYAKDLGYTVRVMSAFMEGEASSVAIECVQTIKKTPNTLFIWGGETTVHLPENAGKGGRNQHLALAGALAMQGANDAYLLSAGTDGTDGMTSATGALVDNHTVEKGRKLGLDAEQYLQQANSNTFLSKTDELIVTGATGTNVMDLVIGISL
jgi:hydroxypyruvate reductase